jgi:hypothetical protein
MPDVDWSENIPLKNFISDFGMLLGAPVWLTRRDGTVAVKSFAGETPDLTKVLVKDKSKRYRGFMLRPFRDFDYHTVLPIVLSGTEVGRNHILFRKPVFFLLKRDSSPLRLPLKNRCHCQPCRSFLFPCLSQDRIKQQLRRSAALISRGDLSHRVKIPGKDEIGDRLMLLMT